MAIWLGLDLGTSGVRALLLDGSGKPLGSASGPYQLSSPRAGWCEQDPGAWWDAVAGAVRAAVRSARISPEDVTGIGVTGQMHGLVLVDGLGAVLRPAIIWPDRRCVPQLRGLDSALAADAVRAVTGTAASTGLLGPNLAWVRQHEPEIYAGSRCALLPKDYLRYLLTGQVHTEPSDACGTLLFDIQRRAWSPRMADALGVDLDKLPPVVDSATVVGGITAAAADALGLRAGTPVVAGASDQATSALALGLTRPGDTSIAISSGGTVVQAATAPPDNPPAGVHTLCAASGGYLLMGATLTAGLALKWLADTMTAPLPDAQPDSAHLVKDDIVGQLARAAEAVPPGAEGLLFLPYLAGERTPHMDAAARGCFLGLTLDHRAGHLARAVMEGVAFALTDCLDTVSAAGTVPRSVVAGGGGLRSPLWRQILADVIGVPVRVTDVDEHSATGAALLAAEGIGRGNGAFAPAEPRTIDVVEPTSPSAYTAHLAMFRRAYRELAPTLRALTGEALADATTTTTWE
ncbi:xylulokinase [Streptomyces sp. NPDC096311]|uniref:xylulokinase n=1 Tax=Streptomyces sp. NPDC096311 TaxID=3366083 RepID=UPI003801AF2B